MIIHFNQDLLKSTSQVKHKLRGQRNLCFGPWYFSGRVATENKRRQLKSYLISKMSVLSKISNKMSILSFFPNIQINGQPQACEVYILIQLVGHGTHLLVYSLTLKKKEKRLHNALFPLEKTSLMVAIIELNDIYVSHDSNIDFT